ncbi:MAG TPA: alpha/beta hydrolase [Bacteroidia bacterium]|nr:alpha/beta hydrolase [Bacteroidia bacterium]
MMHELPDGIQLYFETNGNADSDTTIVFLNGLSQSTQSWLAIAPSFQKEHHVITLDLVFQGQSGVGEKFRTYDEHAADVMHLLEKYGKGKIILCGISYGSAVAQHLLVNYPGKFHSALLLSTFAHDTENFIALGEKWRDALVEGGYPKMLDVMLPDVLGKSYFEKPLIPIETLKESRVARELRTDSLLKLMKATEVRGDYREKLKRVNVNGKVKVIVAQGKEDVLIPPSVAKHVAENIPGAEFVVLEKVGHTLNLEAIPQVIKLLRDLL